MVLNESQLKVAGIVSHDRSEEGLRFYGCGIRVNKDLQGLHLSLWMERCDELYRIRITSFHDTDLHKTVSRGFSVLSLNLSIDRRSPFLSDDNRV